MVLKKKGKKTMEITYKDKIIKAQKGTKIKEVLKRRNRNKQI